LKAGIACPSGPLKLTVLVVIVFVPVHGVSVPAMPMVPLLARTRVLLVLVRLL
jgi:hypothetical protein